MHSAARFRLVCREAAAMEELVVLSCASTDGDGDDDGTDADTADGARQTIDVSEDKDVDEDDEDGSIEGSSVCAMVDIC